MFHDSFQMAQNVTWPPERCLVRSLQLSDQPHNIGELDSLGSEWFTHGQWPAYLRHPGIKMAMKTEDVVPRTLQGWESLLSVQTLACSYLLDFCLTRLQSQASYIIYMISIWLFTLYYKQINVKYSFEFRIIRSDVSKGFGFAVKSDKSTANMRTPMAALRASLLNRVLNLWSLGANACVRCQLIEL